jgi:hypothetical protein
MRKTYQIILGLIVLLGLLIRVVGIADVETGFYVDEASIGYNALSILETGTDEYGQRLPMAFRSFGDYKSPLFVYTVMPLVAVFGVVMGVKLTTVLLGVLTIWLVAEFARKIVGEGAKKNDQGRGEWAGILAGLSLSVLPWHVNLSRHGVEPVLAGCLLAGTLLLLVNKNYKNGMIVLALSTLAYHSTKYISPLLALVVVIGNWRKGVDFKKDRFGWLLVGLVWLGVLWINIQPFSNFRALGVQQAFSIRNILASYLSYFSPRMLSLGDGLVINNIYGVSNVWLWVIGLFYIGVWRSVKILKKDGFKNFGVLLLLASLLLAPLPASATIDPFHAIRALIMVVPISILTGVGGEWVLGKVKKKYLAVLITGMVILIGGQTTLLIERMLVQNKVTAYESWIGGYQQLVEEVMELDINNYTKIVADTTDRAADYSLWQVFGKVDTKQKIPLPHGVNYYEAVDWQTPESLTLRSNQEIFFKPIYWPEDQKMSNTLYVGSVWRFDKEALLRAGAETVIEIKDLTGKVVWMAVATKD